MTVDPKRARGSGYECVDSDVVCLITRFEVRSLWSLFLTYRAFRRVLRGSASVEGLLSASFLLEDRRTCFMLSIWREEAAMLAFNATVHEHIHAANACFRRLVLRKGRPQLWSAILKLWAVSPRNLRWQALDACVSRPVGSTTAEREVRARALGEPA
jgi:hypothetical protein